jgi:hypothetical protein
LRIANRLATSLAEGFGISLKIEMIDFEAIMGRMRRLIERDINKNTGSDNIPPEDPWAEQEIPPYNQSGHRHPMIASLYSITEDRLPAAIGKCLLFLNAV